MVRIKKEVFTRRPDRDGGIELSPHFSPGIVAKRRRCLQIQGARSEGDAGVVDTTLRRPSERNEVDACRFDVAADSW